MLGCWGGGAPPVPTWMGLVGDFRPEGGVGPCPSLSEGGEDAGCFAEWEQDGEVSSREIKRLYSRRPAERSPLCGW